MSRQRKPSRQVSVDEQVQVVLAVLKGELSLAEAAGRHGVSSATVGNWRDWFVDADKWEQLLGLIGLDPKGLTSQQYTVNFLREGGVES